MDKRVRISRIRNGWKTFVTFYLGLFLISKGLEKKGFIIKEEIYFLVAFSHINFLGTNEQILGIKYNFRKKDNKKEAISTIKDPIPLVRTSTFKIGGGACPVARKGSSEFKELKSNMFSFLDYIYEEYLLKKEKGRYFFLEPDYISLLKGSFQSNLDFLEEHPNYFKKL